MSVLNAVRKYFSNASNNRGTGATENQARPDTDLGENGAAGAVAGNLRTDNEQDQCHEPRTSRKISPTCNS